MLIKIICLLTLLIISMTQHALYAQNLLLFNGEVPGVDSCSYFYGGADSLEPYSGTHAFRGEPDQWHSPGINLGCQGAWRADLSGYNELWLYAKASEQGKKIAVGFYGWPNTSNAIDIDPYGSSALDTNYQLYKVPLDSMRTSIYNLASVEILYFGTSLPGDTHKVYIDEVWAMDTNPTSVDSLKIISADVLRIDVKDRYDSNQVDLLSNYSIESTTDPNYISSVSSVEVGRHQYVRGFEDISTTAIPFMKNELFIRFPYPLQNGHSYTLTVNNIRDLAGNDFPAPYLINFNYSDETEITGTVKTNHIGYQPDGPKYGYVGNYLGNSQALNLAPASFEIRDSATHSIQFIGTPVLRGADDRYSGELVYDCDFSGYTQEGSYYLYVPGAGRSVDFRINEKVYNAAYYTTARGLFHQRYEDVFAPYTLPEYEREGCPTISEIDISHSSSAAWDPSSDLPVGTQIPISGGWFDAGDYGRYVPTAAVALNVLLTAYEIYPDKFNDGLLNIPESTNGIPDILDEARIELEWLLQMQAPDGGVYFKVTTAAYAGTMPVMDTAIRYIAEKTTFSTGQFAAVLAAAHRVYNAFDSAFADTCLVRAEKAWQFLTTHPTEIPVGGFTNNGYGGGGEYGDPGGDADERAWAAAELYKSTGDTSYHSAFEYFWLQHSPDWGWNEFQHHQQRASWACCTTTFPTDSNHVNSYVDLLELGIDNYHIPRADSNIYRCSYRSDVIPWIGWGSYAQSTRYSWIFIKGHHLLGKAHYLDYARLNFDTQLGNNPMNRSYITGLGYNQPKDPTHIPSIHDSVENPVPGLPVFGPHSHIPMSNPFYASAQQSENLYPTGEQDNDPYPTLRRYYDCNELVHMSEFTIDYQAVAAVCLARFCNYDPPITTEQTETENNATPLKLYPQPTRYSVILEWQQAVKEGASIIITDMLGRTVQYINWPAGNHSLTIQTGQLAAGNYICLVKNSSATTSSKMLIR